MTNRSTQRGRWITVPAENDGILPCSGIQCVKHKKGRVPATPSCHWSVTRIFQLFASHYGPLSAINSTGLTAKRYVITMKLIGQGKINIQGAPAGKELGSQNGQNCVDRKASAL